MSSQAFIGFMLTIYVCKVKLIKILELHNFDLSRVSKESSHLFIVLSNPCLNTLIDKWHQVHCESPEAFKLEKQIMTLLTSLWKIN